MTSSKHPVHNSFLIYILKKHRKYKRRMYWKNTGSASARGTEKHRKCKRRRYWKTQEVQAPRFCVCGALYIDRAQCTLEQYVYIGSVGSACDLLRQAAWLGRSRGRNAVTDLPAALFERMTNGNAAFTVLWCREALLFRSSTHFSVPEHSGL